MSISVPHRAVTDRRARAPTGPLVSGLVAALLTRYSRMTRASTAEADRRSGDVPGEGAAADDPDRGPDQAVRHVPGADGPLDGGPAGRGLRPARPERVGQDDDASPAAGPVATDIGLGQGGRPRL